MQEKSQPVAFVTGAAAGIGWATAQKFAQQGYRVVVADFNASGAQSRAGELGPDHLAVACDVASEAQVKAAVATAIDRYGRIDVLVNNAGMGMAHKPTVEQTVEEFDNIIGVHLRGTFLTTREVVPHMIAQGGGAIVNLGSIAGVVGLAKRNSYGAAKAGIGQMTKSMACEFAAHGIRVNGVAPGYVDTALVLKLAQDGFIDQKKLCARTPLGRFAQPAEIAEAIYFLASPAASYVTGSMLSVDGGWAAFGDAGVAAHVD